MTANDLRRILLERSALFGRNGRQTLKAAMEEMADGIGVSFGAVNRWAYGERRISALQAARIEAWAGDTPVPSTWEVMVERYETAIRRMCDECDEDGWCPMDDCPLRVVTTHRKRAAA